jgi:hypothetical protein
MPSLNDLEFPGHLKGALKFALWEFTYRFGSFFFVVGKGENEVVF